VYKGRHSYGELIRINTARQDQIKRQAQQIGMFKYELKQVKNPSLFPGQNGFSGHLQVDGNVSYESKGRQAGVTLMHCSFQWLIQVFNHIDDHDINKRHELLPLQQIKASFSIIQFTSLKRLTFPGSICGCPDAYM